VRWQLALASRRRLALDPGALKIDAKKAANPAVAALVFTFETACP